MKLNNILITGAAGFIGSHLVKKLLSLGSNNIVALDSLQYGTWNNLDETNPSLTLIKNDLVNYSVEDFVKLLKENCIDYVFHLAAEKHNQSKDSPQRVLEVNVNASYKLFEASALQKIKKIVFTSTLYAYGQIQAPGMIENQVTKPWTVYGASKLMGENLLECTFKEYGLNYNIARLFFTYGTHQFAGMGYKSVIVSNFERILKGERPKIFGTGTQALDYIYVDDVVNALIKLSNDQYNAEVFNIGSGKSININDLTKLMLEVASSDLKPEYTNADWTEGTDRFSNNNKAINYLDWRVQHSIKEGLTITYNWLKEHEKTKI